jgi:histone H3
MSIYNAVLLLLNAFFPFSSINFTYFGYLKEQSLAINTMEASQPKPAESKQIVKKKKTRFFETYISKVLKQIAAENGITANSKQQLNSAICVIARQISALSTRLTQVSLKKTLSEKEVANAVKIILPGEIAVNALAEGDQSVLKFTAEEDNKNTSRQDKAGIIFPPSITEKFLRNFGFAKIMITKNAPVFLAAVLEYITQDILQLSADMARENKRVRITIRDLELSVRTDPELSVLFTRQNIDFIGGGVVPSIHSSLLIKKPRKKRRPAKSNPSTPAVKKPHRFRPGTVAIREIKRFQKISNCLIFAKHPFERYTRAIIARYHPTMKISKDVFSILQYYIEQYIVNVLKDSNDAAIHCGRVKLMSVDIRFICKLRGYALEEDPEEDPEPEIAELADAEATIEEEEAEEDAEESSETLEESDS